MHTYLHDSWNKILVIDSKEQTSWQRQHLRDVPEININVYKHMCIYFTSPALTKKDTTVMKYFVLIDYWGKYEFTFISWDYGPLLGNLQETAKSLAWSYTGTWFFLIELSSLDPIRSLPLEFREPHWRTRGIIVGARAIEDTGRTWTTESTTWVS